MQKIWFFFNLHNFKGSRDFLQQKQFIFEESHISYGKRQKSCVLIVI